MTEQELEDLKKLSPKERIKKIKEIQEKNKKEIDDAQKLLSKAEEEADVEEELKDIPVPQLKAENIDALFSPEEKDLFKAKRFETEKPEKPPQEELEQIAEQAPELTKEQEQQHVKYIQDLAKTPAEKLAEEAGNIYHNVVEKGYANREEIQRMNEFAAADTEKFRQARTGQYKSITEEVADSMIGIIKMRNKVQNMYRN